jgi:hypothetical protein
MCLGEVIDEVEYVPDNARTQLSAFSMGPKMEDVELTDVEDHAVTPPIHPNLLAGAGTPHLVILVPSSALAVAPAHYEGAGASQPKGEGAQ